MNKKKIITATIIILLIAAGVIAFIKLRSGGVVPSAPAVIIETPDKMNADDREPFSLKLQLTSLTGDNYPAASFSIRFDPSKLEFLGIEEGNIVIKDIDSSSGMSLPDWSVNVDRSNETGIINIMYLDMTGGKYAFTNELLQDTDNVLLLLDFRLRGAVRAGDIIELSLDDAVFASNDETQSLASTRGTLKTVNGRIVIGEPK